MTGSVHLSSICLVRLVHTNPSCSPLAGGGMGQHQVAAWCWLHTWVACTGVHSLNATGCMADGTNGQRNSCGCSRSGLCLSGRARRWPASFANLRIIIVATGGRQPAVEPVHALFMASRCFAGGRRVRLTLGGAGDVNWFPGAHGLLDWPNWPLGVPAGCIQVLGPPRGPTKF